MKRAATSIEENELPLDHQIRVPKYNFAGFTEGFDTADLKDAKALLDELNA